ncbi:MAG: hypothetical protein KatS3mg010_1806 [Acidimicrobiia bacterium]|nr:MAG: hypothetical protein KatS3mg010_1806 [Acidimicrobiia bacterium]
MTGPSTIWDAVTTAGLNRSTNPQAIGSPFAAAAARMRSTVATSPARGLLHE